MTGSLVDSMRIGGDPLFGAGSQDVFVAKFDPSGNHLFSERFGELDTDSGRGIACDSAGNAILIGSFANAIDFGGGLLDSPGGVDSYLVKLGP